MSRLACAPWSHRAELMGIQCSWWLLQMVRAVAAVCVHHETSSTILTSNNHCSDQHITSISASKIETASLFDTGFATAVFFEDGLLLSKHETCRWSTHTDNFHGVRNTKCHYNIANACKIGDRVHTLLLGHTYPCSKVGLSGGFNVKIISSVHDAKWLLQLACCIVPGSDPRTYLLWSCWCSFPLWYPRWSRCRCRLEYRCGISIECSCESMILNKSSITLSRTI